MRILQIAWVLEAACKVHYEAVKSQKEDLGRGGVGMFQTVMEGAKQIQSGKRTSFRVEVDLRGDQIYCISMLPEDGSSIEGKGRCYSSGGESSAKTAFSLALLNVTSSFKAKVLYTHSLRSTTPQMLPL